MNTSNITRQLVAEQERINHTAKLFGLNFPMRLEPTIFNIAGNLSSDYYGGLWHFWRLSNNGFYMSPASDKQFRVSCENGFEGSMSADAFGVVCCLYALSHLSFGEGAFAETCAEHFHLLREFALDHAEMGSILRATD